MLKTWHPTWLARTAFLLALVAEAEGILFVVLGVVAHRPDLFLDAQPMALPAAVLVAALAVFRQRGGAAGEGPAPQPVDVLPPVEISQRIGVRAPVRVRRAEPPPKWRRNFRR